VACCVLIFASTGEGGRLLKSDVLNGDDLKEIASFTAYFVNRLVHKRSSSESKEMAEDAKYSSYVSTISDVAEQGWTVPQLDLFQDAAADICYLGAKHVFGKTENVALEAKAECRRSKYVEYLYTAIKQRVFKPESPLISEAFGDACYWTCSRSRSKCLARERRCEKTQYVDLFYNLFQGKNRFTTEVLNEMVQDGCFLGHYLTQGKSFSRAQDFGLTCRHHEATGFLVALVQVVLKGLGWPLEHRTPRYNDFDF